MIFFCILVFLNLTKLIYFLHFSKNPPKTEHGGGAATGGLRGDPSMKSDPGTEGRRFLRGTFHAPSTKKAVLVDGEGEKGGSSTK
jgi:hypothetical protein